jgi:hypothetical protein
MEMKNEEGRKIFSLTENEKKKVDQSLNRIGRILLAHVEKGYIIDYINTWFDGDFAMKATINIVERPEESLVVLDQEEPCLEAAAMAEVEA